MIAIQFDHMAIATHLIQSGADPNLCDHDGRSALDYANDMTTLKKGDGATPLQKEYRSTLIQMLTLG